MNLFAHFDENSQKLHERASATGRNTDKIWLFLI